MMEYLKENDGGMMRKVIFILMIICSGAFIHAEVNKPFEETDMLLRQEETQRYYQPDWATESLNIRGVKRFPYFNDFQCVYVIDTLAYICAAARLGILNIKDETNPQLVGYIDLSWNAQSLFVRDTIAYVAEGYAGLSLYNVSDPANPRKAGFFDVSYNEVSGVYVSDDYAYITDYYDGLQIIDVSDPNNPFLVGEYNTSGQAYEVYVVDTMAYISDGTAGLVIINVADKSNPILVGSFNTNGTTKWTVVEGNYAYLADNTYGLRILDISNPTAPVEIGHYDTSEEAINISKNGIYLYVADDFTVHIFDVTNPALPKNVGTCASLSFPNMVFSLGDYTYSCSGNRGFKICNTHVPDSNIFTGYYLPPQFALNVTISGNYAYVSFDGGLDNGIDIFDISDLSQTELPRTSFFSPDGYPQDIAIDGNYAYVASGYNGFQTMDVSNPLNPVETGQRDTPDNARGIVVKGNYAYVAANEAGLRIFDISNPSVPIEVCSLYILNYARDIDVQGDYAYISCYAYGTRIIDISDPLNPFQVGWCTNLGGVERVFVSGNYEYLASSFGLMIVDISEPLNPYELGYCDVSILNTYVVGNYAYAACYDGVRIVNVSDPKTPTVCAYYLTDYECTGISVKDTLIFVANQESGFLILDCELDTIMPSTFNLISPIGNTNINTPTFLWHGATDSNLKEYRIYLDDSLIVTIADTTYISGTALADGEHYWYAMAVDSMGNSTRSMEVDTFIIDATKPSIPLLALPLNRSVSSTGVFVWHSSTDSYSGVKEYNLWFDEDSLFASPESIVTIDTTYTAVLFDYTYYWKVRAIDNFDNIGNWSLRWSFDFSPAGISDKLILSTKEESRTSMTVSMNEIQYTTTSLENQFIIYDVCGKIIYKSSKEEYGRHLFKYNKITSGIYFVRFKDGMTEINRKIAIIQ